MQRKLVAIALILSLLIAYGGGSALAYEIQPITIEPEVEMKIIALIGETEVTIQRGEKLYPEDLGAPFTSSRDGAKAPLRAVVERFGGNVFWIPEGKRILVVTETDMVLTQIGSKEIVHNGSAYTLDAPIEQIDGTTYAPLELMVLMKYGVFSDELAERIVLTKYAF